MRRFRAPAGDGDVLADPGFDRVPGLVERNRRRLDTADVWIGGVSLRELRQLARREVLQAASESTQSPPIAMGGLTPDTPLLLAGHQPELAHPGVWVKHFALTGLARRVGGVPLNLVVDNDTMKSAAVRFPVRDPAGVRLESVSFDTFHGEEPYESRRVHDAERFRTFAERAAPLWQPWGVEPLLLRVWPDVATDPTPTIGGKFTAARRKREREWGCDNFELPVSRLADTPAFGRFVSHIAADAGRFRACYNAAVQGYRAAHGIESKSHPVPDLAPDELPFWVRTATNRRERMSAGRPTGSVRPRALTLTLFARLCLGDFFLHGIGGGKYDEVTDHIIRDYFGLEPPAYQVLSATLHLPLPGFPSTADGVQRLARLERDLYWNPHRHLPAEVVGPLAEEHAGLAACEPGDPAGRRQRYRNFRRLGDLLRPLAGPQVADVREQLDRARREVAANAVLRRRDYAWVLYPEGPLKPFLQRFLEV